MARTSRLSTSSLTLISKAAETCNSITLCASPLPPRLLADLLTLSWLTSKLIAEERRERCQATIREKSIRLSPGTSDLLHSPLSSEVCMKGRMDVISYDLVKGFAPMHLLGGKVDRKSRR